MIRHNCWTNRQVQRKNYLCVTSYVFNHLQQQHNSVQSVDDKTFWEARLIWDLQIQGEWGMILMSPAGLSNRLVLRIHFRVDSMSDSFSGVASGRTPRFFVFDWGERGCCQNVWEDLLLYFGDLAKEGL